MKTIFAPYVSLFMTLALLGCGVISSGETSGTATTTENTGTAANETSVSLNAPVIIPPNYDERPLEVGQSENPTLPNGLPALSPAKGLNIDTLFSKTIKDTDKRIDRLENAFIDFRKEYEQIKPAVVRLAAIESDLQNLMNELDGFVEQESIGPSLPAIEDPATTDEALPIDLQTPPGAPITETSQAPALPTPEAPETASAPPSTLIQNIRTGIHADKVRLVIDTAGQIEYTATITADKQLTLTLPQTGPSTSLPHSKTLPKNAVLTSYTLSASVQTTTLTFQLNRATRILSQSILPPKGAQSLHRLVIDLAK